MKLAELKTKLAQTQPGSPIHRALKTAITQAEAKLAADEAARAEVEAQARAEAEAKALVEAEEKARLEAEAAEKGRLEAEAAEKARLEAEATKKQQQEVQTRTRTGTAPLYQALGRVCGRLSRDDNGKIHLSAYGVDWEVQFLKKTYQAIVIAFEANDPKLHGDLDLLCYPIVHRNQGGNYSIAGFKVVAFNSKTEDTTDAEFILAGIWQRLSREPKQGFTEPVLSVYRNRQPVQRSKKKRRRLVTHCPLIWPDRDPWEPGSDQPQGWVRIKARLRVSQNVFEFLELLDECDRAPRQAKTKCPKQLPLNADGRGSFEVKFCQATMIISGEFCYV
jgi:hypothetical protein